MHMFEGYFHSYLCKSCVHIQPNIKKKKKKIKNVNLTKNHLLLLKDIGKNFLL